MDSIEQSPVVTQSAPQQRTTDNLSVTSLIAVSGLVILLVSSVVEVFMLMSAGKDPKDLIALATAGAGILTALLVPSPLHRP